MTPPAAAIVNKDEKVKNELQKGGIEPTQVDVLLSRTHAAFEHPGNINFRAIVASQVEKYKRVARTGKGELITSVLKQIRKNKGRFLRYEKGRGWTDAGFVAGRNKVAHLFRDASNNRSVCVRDLMDQMINKNQKNENMDQIVRKQKNAKSHKKSKEKAKQKMRIVAIPEETETSLSPIACENPFVLKNAASPPAGVVQKKKPGVAEVADGRNPSEKVGDNLENHPCIIVEPRPETTQVSSSGTATAEGWAAARFYASGSDDDEDNCYDRKIPAQKPEELMFPENQAPRPPASGQSSGAGDYQLNLNISLDFQPHARLTHPSILQSLLPQAALESVVNSALQSAIRSAIQSSFESTLQSALQSAIQPSFDSTLQTALPTAIRPDQHLSFQPQMPFHPSLVPLQMLNSPPASSQPTSEDGWRHLLGASNDAPTGATTSFIPTPDASTSWPSYRP